MRDTHMPVFPTFAAACDDRVARGEETLGAPTRFPLVGCARNATVHSPTVAFAASLLDQGLEGDLQSFADAEVAREVDRSV